MKANIVQVKLFDESDRADLEAAINTWLEDADEKELVGEIRIDGSDWSAIIQYTE